MARTTKKIDEVSTENVNTENVVDEVSTEAVEEKCKGEEPNAKVLELMKLYPQYEEFWVTPKGFVHPKNAPKYCIKNAVLYTNKYYKNKK